MEQTAVEYVEYIDEYLRNKGIIIEDKTIPQVLIGIINEAKDIEKQQIIDAVDITNKKWKSSQVELILDGKQYYNKTFKK